jgi:branched-chain amino acid transport system ATP-binding protein
MAAALLAIRDLACRHGGVPALRGVTLDVAAGEVVALLGRNGAGKTTLIRSIMGFTAITGGTIRFDGADLVGRPPHRIPGLGIGLVPQGRRLFGDLTVAENLRVPAFAGRAGPPMAATLDHFPVLAERLDQRAGSLSGGEQQMLAIARALRLAPRLLLMDEPTEGLMPAMIAAIAAIVTGLKAAGVGVLLVEQKVDAALAVADRVVFLENGRSHAGDTAVALKSDRARIDRFVGAGGA